MVHNFFAYIANPLEVTQVLQFILIFPILPELNDVAQLDILAALGDDVGTLADVIHIVAKQSQLYVGLEQDVCIGLSLLLHGKPRTCLRDSGPYGPPDF